MRVRHAAIRNRLRLPVGHELLDSYNYLQHTGDYRQIALNSVEKRLMGHRRVLLSSIRESPRYHRRRLV